LIYRFFFISYFSEVSAGGTRTKKKKKRIRDADGNIIGYGSAKYHDSSGKFLCQIHKAVTLILYNLMSGLLKQT